MGSTPTNGTNYEETMKQVLILDDDPHGTRIPAYRDRFDELACEINVVHVETVEECKERLSNQVFDLVLLDHDLNGEIFVDPSRKDCGTEIARWWNSKENLNKDQPVIVHSKNSGSSIGMIEIMDYGACIPRAWRREYFPEVLSLMGKNL